MSDQTVLTFWTPERISQASANPLPAPAVTEQAAIKAHEKATQRGTKNPQGAATAAAGAVAPLRTHTKRTRTSPLASAARVTDLSRSDLASPLGPDINITGRLFFLVGSDRLGSCTAAGIVASNKNSIWTAGHCLHSGKGGGFYSNFLFAPGYDETAPWGYWPLRSIIVSSS
ncbi:hypothetical protein [Kitasatospora sp. NPDC005751]|uniref:trypsin-like serine peptidase n=1 Tax=Kitasatospora sp. NPDC005751 TaxID=3157064 RepID=UPI0033ECA30F